MFVDHLAGIIPLAYQKLDFTLPWQDYLIPIGKDYLVCDRAVQEAAMAGCDTIWIVGYPSMPPIVKHRITTQVLDPISVIRNEYDSRTSLKKIPVYWISLNKPDIGVRDSLAWSTMYGAMIARKTLAKLTEWVVPEKYFISLPHGITKLNEIRVNRDKISKTGKNIRFTHNGKSVLDDLPINYTVDGKDIEIGYNYLKNYGVGTSTSLSDARFVKNSEVLSLLPSVKNAEEINLESYFPVDNWENYCKYMASGMPLNTWYRRKQRSEPLPLGTQYKRLTEKEAEQAMGF
jgi:hypothetical protein